MEMDIERLVINQVKSELHEMDIKEVITDIVRATIKAECGKTISEIAKEVAASMISEQVKAFLSEEINLDDGWGKKTTYQSFEDMFKQTLKKQMLDAYDVRREVARQVEGRISSLVKQEYAKIIEKVVDELTKSRIVKSPDSKPQS